jgi:hypothetical protein
MPEIFVALSCLTWLICGYKQSCSAYWNGVQLKSLLLTVEKDDRKFVQEITFRLLFSRVPFRISARTQVSWCPLYFFSVTSGMYLDNKVRQYRFLQSVFYFVIHRNIITRRQVAWVTNGSIKYITNRKRMSRWLPVIGYVYLLQIVLNSL